MTNPHSQLINRWEARLSKYDKKETSDFNMGFTTALSECIAELLDIPSEEPDQDILKQIYADNWLSSVEAHEPSNYY